MSDETTQTDNGDASAHEDGSRSGIEVETVLARTSRGHFLTGDIASLRSRLEA